MQAEGMEAWDVGAKAVEMNPSEFLMPNMDRLSTLICSLPFHVRCKFSPELVGEADETTTAAPSEDRNHELIDDDPQSTDHGTQLTGVVRACDAEGAAPVGNTDGADDLVDSLLMAPTAIAGADPAVELDREAEEGDALLDELLAM
eukprot:TRINITY_DN28000_c0_g1_i2.p1 TRINITY_DN28000_c0_g1~~TRINITY_DN28000_c0_g1_i2.p1  ORF type:complete len:146 (-),score=46.67 TRINITY_DN28000_c0_g1_i2:243-680(-)